VDIRFDGKTALVTGGSRGVGYACAETLVESGAAVVLAAIDGAEVEAATKALSPKGRVRGYQTDVADVAGLPLLVSRVREEVGRSTSWFGQRGCSAAARRWTSPRRTGTRFWASTPRDCSS
jgi:NAD(P)-dependent dehydrogenase (short-subunit alcohol dehydrogenase family)